MVRKSDRLYLVLLLASGLAAFLSHPARADGACAGTVQGSPIRPMAQPVVVSPERPIDAQRDPALAQRFQAGMRTAGVTVAPSGQGSTILALSFLFKAASGSKPGGRTRTFSNLSWMTGGTGAGRQQPDLRGAQVGVTIYARDAASRTLAWTGTISCAIQTDDPGVLAEGLGKIVGGALGRSIPRAAL